jgi:hypothetical protein
MRLDGELEYGLVVPWMAADLLAREQVAELHSQLLDDQLALHRMGQQ